MIKKIRGAELLQFLEDRYPADEPRCLLPETWTAMHARSRPDSSFDVQSPPMPIRSEALRYPDKLSRNLALTNSRVRDPAGCDVLHAPPIFCPSRRRLHRLGTSSPISVPSWSPSTREFASMTHRSKP